MKKTDVLLSIKGIHTTEYDTDTLEFITSGTLVSEGDDCSVSYQETEMTGMEGLMTTLYIHGATRWSYAARAAMIPSPYSKRGVKPVLTTPKPA